MGLLTKIFGNREDEATGADEGSEQSVESSEMHEPDDKAQSQLSQVSSGTSGSGSDAPPETAKPASTAQPVQRSQPPRARTNRRNGELQEQRDLSTRGVARPPAQRVDATSKRQPTPASSAVRNLQTGGKVTEPIVGAASARGTTRAASAKAPGAQAASTAMPAPAEARDQADDSEEIDVSDQLETLDDTDSADDLDASDDLIIDEDEEETSTRVSAPGVVGSSSEEAPASVSSNEKLEGEVLGLPPDTVSNPRGTDVRRTTPPNETSETNLDAVSMSIEMKTPKQTLVEAGTEFKGTLKSSCPVAVNGTIDGEIDAPTLNIASSGSVLGSVKAKTLRSRGTLSGNVDAEEVFLSGAVRSKTFIKTRRLEMKLGSLEKGQLEVTFGNCDLDSNDA